MSTYSFNDVVATIAGPTGSADLAYDAAPTEEGITVEPAGDKNTMSIGADGSVMHSLHADKSARCVVRLQKTSPANAQLMQMYDAQTISAALHGLNTIFIQQKASSDVLTLRQVAFKRRPAINYQKEGGMVEWEFDVGLYDGVLGKYPTS